MLEQTGIEQMKPGQKQSNQVTELNVLFCPNVKGTGAGNEDPPDTESSKRQEYSRRHETENERMRKPREEGNPTKWLENNTRW